MPKALLVLFFAVIAIIVVAGDGDPDYPGHY
jgi:hypothetical protein